ncbi:MAG: 5'-3' exonuclease H3TH domain-containing protein, partial [Candidatus Electryonea clarkiae]|nr:5'-3' exonuclease H3TH domain-containing protein [Candidatus Electryonea clarkiae]
MSERLFLIDAMAQIYRMHFAIGRHPLITSKGENVSAVYGFINTLLALIDRENPDKLAVVYDSPHPTFRHHIYKEYKATREKMPDELAAQLPRLEQILRALNIPIVVLPGYEADDLIGTLAKEAEMNGMQVYMVTGDKDYYQLVTNNVFFYSTKQGLSNAEVLYPDDVKKIFGVLPGQVIDVLGLAGDSSDNVPGVPKVGIKTALSLLSKYENMEEALNHWKEVGGKVGENLREYREQAIISKNLVTIRTTAPIAENIEDLNFGPLDTKEARKLFTELEFKRLLNYLDKGKK